MDFSESFKDKKITVMGLGLLGRGVGDVAYLASSGADLIVTDLKSEEELKESLEKLKEFENISYTLGEHKKEDFEGRDFILVGAGVPFDSEFVKHGSEASVRVTQSAVLFAEISKIPMIGVTGTRGKSTVTQMIYHVLSVITGEEVILGGNIRGVSNLQLLKKVKEDSIAVFELDSWQLQGFAWAEISPQIAVFTNFMEDHMNYYKDDMDVYFKDKANIFKYQEESGVLVTTPEVFARAQKLQDVTLGQEVVLADSSVIPEDANLAMPGEHNRLNAALAYEALKAVSVTPEEIFEGLASFPGVEGRLQLMKTVENVRVYNDNNATTPAATVAALEALDLGNKNIVLIAGGSDKNIDLSPLTEAIEKHCKQVILIPGSGTDRLVKTLEGSTAINRSIIVECLEQAFEEARLAAENGDIILFSPAFASFGTYANEYERNDTFVDIVSKV
ncbi:UDP-N-acetylmuramoyl-L-alanine--D-glutamate ligase [Candidatus Pacebacteria bacterium]|nr:UDP-N-acetylmuramoyl-L-alanine--D-glutamate ligase [Candidatus Paceibacterota bacterium]